MSTNAPSTHFSSRDEDGWFGENGLLNTLGGALGFSLFNDENFVGEAVDELSGYNSQQREFEWNDESEQMKRLTKAGINANTAGSTIASGKFGSASSSSAAAQGLQSAVGVAEQLANTNRSSAEATDLNSTRESRIAQLDSDAQAKLAEAGFDAWQTESIKQRLPLMVANDYMDMSLKISQLPILSQQYENMKAQHEEILENINLIRETQGVEAARKLQIEEMTRWQKQENDFAEANGYRRGDPVDSALMQCYSNKGAKKAQELGRIVIGYKGSVAKVEENAKADATWKSRPTTPTEAAYFVTKQVADEAKRQHLDDWIKSHYREFKNDIKSIRQDAEAYKEFRDAYRDARDELYSNYLKWKSEYKSIRHTAASDMYKAEVMRKRDDAYKAYEDFTEDVFKEQYSRVKGFEYMIGNGDAKWQDIK